MATNSKIEWTDKTWNCVTGCTKTSTGCLHCYAENMTRRLKGMGQPNYQNGFALTMHPDMLNKPLTWKKPGMVFVCSMSDLFHKDVTDSFIKEVFRVMSEAHWHKFQVLTKRSERLAQLAPELPWPDNVWAGVTVESQKYMYRIDDLRRVPAVVRFVSLEPLLEDLGKLDLTGIHWVIVGGESGPGARPMLPEWVTSIRAQCHTARVRFFFKQWGGFHKKKAGRELNGRTWDEMPAQWLH